MDFSDDGFSDDDDFIALTLKPPPRQTATQTPTPQPQAQAHVQVDSSKSNRSNVIASSQFPRGTAADSNEIFVAKGEIAVLRAKISELEKLKQIERDELLQRHNQDKSTNEHKILALQDAVQRLEDERKFLSVEVRNLNHIKKKKKTNEHIAEPSRPSTPEPSILKPSKPQEKPIAQQQQQPTTKPKQVKLIQPKQQTSENLLFIQSLQVHTLPSCPRSTLDYLSHISIPQTYHDPEHDPIFKIQKDEPISTHILQFLLQKQSSTRLDNLLTSLIQNLLKLMDFITTTIQKNHVSIPFLISLIHSCINFRPMALQHQIRSKIAEFSVQMIDKFGHIVKKHETLEDEALDSKRFKIGVVQHRVLDGLIHQFSVELLESLLLIEDDLNQDESFWSRLDLDILGKELKNGVNSGCIGVMYSYVEILIILENHGKSMMNTSVLSSLSKVLYDGVLGMVDLEFCGMNRMFHDEIETWRLIDGLVLPDGVTSEQQVVHTQEDRYGLDNLEFKVINLQLKICELIEAYIMSNNFNDIEPKLKNSTLFKIIIKSIGKQQEFIFKSPRGKITHLRSKLISNFVKLIHLIWELSNTDTNLSSTTTNFLSKDITHELIITLSRIAFSSNKTSNESSNFIYSFRSIDLNSTIFNKYSETRSREINHILNTDATDQLESIVNAEISVSNGVEFAYDDIIVELARDILEKCTTMDEADNLYLSMNA